MFKNHLILYRLMANNKKKYKIMVLKKLNNDKSYLHPGWARAYQAFPLCTPLDKVQCDRRCNRSPRTRITHIVSALRRVCGSSNNIIRSFRNALCLSRTILNKIVFSR